MEVIYLLVKLFLILPIFILRFSFFFFFFFFFFNLIIDLNYIIFLLKQKQTQSSATTKNLAEGLQEVLNATAQDILREAFCGKDGELTTIVNTTLNNTLSSFSTFITPFLIPPPPLSPSLPPPHVLNLSSPVFEIVPFLVNDFLGTTGPLNINNFINYLTGDGSVELGGLLSLTPFSSPFLSLSFLDGVFGVDLDLARLVVSDLDQVSDLEVFFFFFAFFILISFFLILFLTLPFSPPPSRC